ncbi:oligosaccharide flippase family protein [Pedobacter cryophilus]|uniref:Polysaccharide biosynthesis protein C-terminal domain-containing protein n=1 Tax=Pedobacter cryophilus TaxID=2571271 RepID=A0A4U1C4X5_9SPHI|nr:oligosaccharide flippase family protein [Pedobacter cryophilus]TKC00453.1 hypothetical protein FA046_01875 [Pedobacter cryophilus]
MNIRYKLLNKNNRLFINGFLSILQVVFLSLSYFIIYTLLLRKLGPTKLGIWSIVLATSSVGGVASAGLTSSLVKYIANYSRERDYQKINSLIKTGLISLTVLNLFIIIILFYLGNFFLPKVVPITELAEVTSLLPLSLLSLLLNTTGGIFLSAIDGLHFSFLRSVIYIFSSLLFLLLAYFFIDIYGLKGIAFAQIAQGFFVIISSLGIIKSIFIKFSLYPLIWEKKVFRKIFNYSLNFQIISFCSIFTEPLTKFLLSKYSGLDFVGIYEMASRLISQLRSLMVSANQILVPFISNKFSIGKNAKDESYPIVLKFSYYIACISMLFLIIFSPIISFYWIGVYSDVFVYSTILVGLAMIVNIVSTPSYFSSMGMGKLNGIKYSHIAILIVNGILGLILGPIFKGWGILVSYSVALIVGSLITLIYYHKMYDFSIREIFKKSGILSTLYIFLCLIITTVSYNFNLTANRLIYSIVAFIILSIYIIWIYFNEDYLKFKIDKFIKNI